MTEEEAINLAQSVAPSSWTWKSSTAEFYGAEDKQWVVTLELSDDSKNGLNHRIDLLQIDIDSSGKAGEAIPYTRLITDDGHKGKLGSLLRFFGLIR